MLETVISPMLKMRTLRQGEDETLTPGHIASMCGLIYQLRKAFVPQKNRYGEIPGSQEESFQKRLVNII